MKHTRLFLARATAKKYRNSHHHARKAHIPDQRRPASPARRNLGWKGHELCSLLRPRNQGRGLTFRRQRREGALTRCPLLRTPHRSITKALLNVAFFRPIPLGDGRSFLPHSASWRSVSVAAPEKPHARIIQLVRDRGGARRLLPAPDAWAVCGFAAA
jgi:hypothetical protein